MSRMHQGTKLNFLHTNWQRRVKPFLTKDTIPATTGVQWNTLEGALAQLQIIINPVSFVAKEEDVQVWSKDNTGHQPTTHKEQNTDTQKTKRISFTQATSEVNKIQTLTV